MRAFLLAWLWLAMAGSFLFSQSLSFPRELRPYHINPIRVEGLDPLSRPQSLRLLGVRYDGATVPLFRGPGTPSGNDLLCYAYLDEDIKILELEARTSSGRVIRLSASVERPPFTIGVYGFPGPLEDRGPWRRLLFPEALRPGDVRLLAPGENPQPALSAGIHVLTPMAAAAQTEAGRNPWQGYLLAASGAEGPALMTVLEERREALIEFKQRYGDLPATLSFLALPVERTEPLLFPPATPTAIAYTLQTEMLRDRVGPRYRYALIVFSAALLAATAVLRRWRLLLPLAGVLLGAFVVFTFLSPPGIRSLTVELSLPVSGEAGQGRAIRLEPVDAGSGDSLRYRQAGIPAGSWKLVYRCLLAAGGEAPLQLLGSEELVRFNQVPEIRQEDGLLVLDFRNPLSSWSLHEPE